MIHPTKHMYIDLQFKRVISEVSSSPTWPKILRHSIPNKINKTKTIWTLQVSTDHHNQILIMKKKIPSMIRKNPLLFRMVFSSEQAYTLAHRRVVLKPKRSFVMIDLETVLGFLHNKNVKKSL